MRNIFALMLLLVIMFGGCERNNQPEGAGVPQEYLNYLPGNGVYSGAQAARRSISQDDFVALAVGQDCIVVPFFSRGCGAPTTYAGHSIAWRLIPHTSDKIENKAFQTYAERFAFDYNAELAAYLRQHPYNPK